MRRAALLFIAAALVLAAQVLRDPNASSLIPISRVLNLAVELAARPLKSSTYVINRTAKINASGEIESIAGTATHCVQVNSESTLCDAADVVKKGSPFSAGVPKINGSGTLETIPGTATDCIKVDGSTTPCGGTATSRFVARIRMVDDFTGGESLSAEKGIGRIGSLGWSLEGTSPTALLSFSGTGSFGFYRLSAANGTGSVMYLTPREGLSWYALNQNGDFIFNTRVIDGSDNNVRIGFMDVIGESQPANGAYVEKLAADTSWFCVSRASGTETRSGILSYAQDTWTWLRIRKTAGGWACSAAANPVALEFQSDIVVATNIPGAVAGHPVVQFNKVTSGQLDIDKADITVDY